MSAAGPLRRLVAYVPDLMDRSRLSAAPAEITFVNDPAGLASAAVGADLVLVDLTRPGVLQILPDLTSPVIGFANHTERDLMDAARAAGCATVLARSAFFSRVGDLLGPPTPADP